MKRGPYKKEIRSLHLDRAVALRAQGYGYARIANTIGDGLSPSTIANWVKDVPCDRSLPYRMHSILNPKPPVSKGSIRRSLIARRGPICEGCGLMEWVGRPIMLEMDHIDGNKKNDVETNLRLLCPNCHSQTPTWRRRKK